MKRIIEFIPFVLLVLVPEFSLIVLNPYLISKGLIPREGNMVTIFGISAFFLGVLAGWIIAKDNKKRGNSKEST